MSSAGPAARAELITVLKITLNTRARRLGAAHPQPQRHRHEHRQRSVQCAARVHDIAPLLLLQAALCVCQALPHAEERAAVEGESDAYICAAALTEVLAEDDSLELASVLYCKKLD